MWFIRPIMEQYLLNPVTLAAVLIDVSALDLKTIVQWLAMKFDSGEKENKISNENKHFARRFLNFIQEQFEYILHYFSM